MRRGQLIAVRSEHDHGLRQSEVVTADQYAAHGLRQAPCEVDRR